MNTLKQVIVVLGYIGTSTQYFESLGLKTLLSSIALKIEIQYCKCVSNLLQHGRERMLIQGNCSADTTMYHIILQTLSTGTERIPSVAISTTDTLRTNCISPTGFQISESSTVLVEYRT